MRQIDRDVDPAVVAVGAASRAAYSVKTATWGNPQRCRTNICDQDGSSVYCGDDQGACSRCTHRFPRRD
jgi:hypothetical protein